MSGNLGPDMVYDKPGLICYANHTILVAFFPIVYVMRLCSGKMSFRSHFSKWLGSFTFWRAFYEYSVLSVAYAICIWSWCLGLTMISVGSSNAIYQLQCAFTVFFSVTILKDELTLNKKIGVTVCFVGIAIVVGPPMLQDPNGAGEDPLTGSLLTLLSAVLWGGYEVAYTYISERKNSNRVSMSPSLAAPDKMESVLETMTTLAMIGLTNMIFVIPLLWLLDVTGVEKLELPQTDGQWEGLFLNAMLSFCFDLSFALAIFLTSPVVVAISSALVIPLSFVADYFLHGAVIYPVCFLGSAVVVGGLCILETRKPVSLAWCGCGCETGKGQEPRKMTEPTDSESSSDEDGV